MNDGIIAARYARALLKYVRETGQEDETFAQASSLVLLFRKIPRFREAVEGNKELSIEKKTSFMETALNRELTDALKRFAFLADTHSRMGYWSRMLSSFVDMYMDSRNMKPGVLVTAIPQNGLKERLEAAMGKRFGAEVVLDARVDESLTGGFILEVGDLRMDASVAGQFRRIRKELVEKDNRII